MSLFHGHWWIWAGAAMVLLYVIAQVVKYPKQILWKLGKSAVIGCLFVIAVNWVGSYFHYHMPLNAVTTLVSGFLGLPGVAALVALQLWVFQA